MSLPGLPSAPSLTDELLDHCVGHTLEETLEAATNLLALAMLQVENAGGIAGVKQVPLVEAELRRIVGQGLVKKPMVIVGRA